MKGYYWKASDGWFFRENKKAENWHGPYSSRKEAIEERMKLRQKHLKVNRLIITKTGGLR